MSRLDFGKHHVEIILSSIFLIAAAYLNLQFLSGANLNSAIAGHDEYLTIKDVYSILAPLSFKHFILAVLHGSFLAYGSAMFYIDALIAFIPFKLFGLSGMVYSIRMTHALFLVLGVSLLSVTFLRSTVSKVLFMLGVLAVAHTFYFAMMPKPEPMQLFFFALFLHYFKKNDWAFGKHFFWLGLAFGLKITLLIFIPFLFVLPFVEKGRLLLKKNLKGGIRAGIFFLLGFFLAVPYLLLAVVRPTYLNSFLEANLGSATKAYDNTTISLFDWLGKGLTEPYLGLESLGIFFAALLLLLVLYQAYRTFKEKEFRGEYLLGFFGLLFIVFIALKVDRLWPHYMWMGYILAVLALNELQSRTSLNALKKGLLFINICIVGLVFIRLTSHNFEKYFMADKKPEIVQRMADAELLFEYIDSSYDAGVHVATDGSIYYPYEQFVKEDIYHPFANALTDDGTTKYKWHLENYDEIWDSSNDLVVFRNRHPIKDNAYLGKEFPHWDMDQNVAAYERHLQTDFEVDTVIGGIEVYRRISLLKRINR